jgi:hypothetical protein
MATRGFLARPSIAPSPIVVRRQRQVCQPMLQRPALTQMRRARQRCARAWATLDCCSSAPPAVGAHTTPHGELFAAGCDVSISRCPMRSSTAGRAAEQLGGCGNSFLGFSRIAMVPTLVKMSTYKARPLPWHCLVLNLSHSWCLSSLETA